MWNALFRIVTHIAGEEKVLCEAAQKTDLALGHWHHLTWAYCERLHGTGRKASVGVGGPELCNMCYILKFIQWTLKF